MSTTYCSLKPILARHLLDGRLQEYGVREDVDGETTEKKGVLTDGQNYLWYYVDDAGLVTCFKRYMPNGNPGKILDAIAEATDTEIVSEYEPQFFGFDTQEERDAWEWEIYQEHQQEFREDLMKFVRGEPNDIRPGTIGADRADVAKKVVESDPALLLAENKHKLEAELKSISENGHGLIKINPVLQRLVESKRST